MSPAQGLEGVQRGLEAQEVRTCWDCGKAVPLSAWYFRKKGLERVPKSCKTCHVRRALEWRQKNVQAHKTHQTRYASRSRARARAYREIFEQKAPLEASLVDVVRRALAEAPPASSTEGERLSFYQGFLKGCEHKHREDSRFEQYKDLVFRICSELSMQFRQGPGSFGYEEMVSIAYEAVLEVVRKRREPSRNDVAGAIRYRIRDAARERFGRTESQKARKGRVNFAGEAAVGRESDGTVENAIERLAVSRDRHALDDTDLYRAIKEKTEAELGPRFADMLVRRMEGATLKEIGKAYGLSESRVCGLFNEHKEWMEENLAPLAGHERKGDAA
jgi:hypothetical protein